MDALVEMISRGFEQLLGRASGPLHLRLAIMPTVVTILAIRARLTDARNARPAFLWGVLAHPANRREHLRSAGRDLTRVFIIALAIDTVFQLLFLHGFYLVQLLVVAIACAILPYVVIRGPANRLIRCIRGNQARASSPQGASSSRVAGAATSVLV